MGMGVMQEIADTGQIVPEPDWTQIYSDTLDQAAAHKYWRDVADELRGRKLLSKANSSALERLISIYLVFDRATKDVAENGAVTKPRRNNPKAIIRVSPHWNVMREASAAAALLESELGLSPGKRSKATGLPEQKGPARPRDEFLRRVK